MKNGPYELVIAPENYPGKKYRDRYVYEHHLIWWQNTATLVPDGMVIHHKNEQKRDNRFENLELMAKADHVKEHKSSPFNERGELKLQEAVCAWCGISFLVKGHSLRHRKKANNNIFCSRSHSVKHQHAQKKLSV